jgi:ABC-type dipeptide/oligopeptide/nickel transport system ATPase component
MAQRAAVACALARRSRFLFCDEPTTGLDAEVQAALVLELQTLARGPDARGIVFVTHDIALLDGFADRILVLDRGTIAEEAPTARALVGPGRALVEATLALQAGSS